jgi:hypothetical protein
MGGRYGGAVDVKRAADMYSRGWTLRQIAAEPGVHWSTVSYQLQSARIIMRRSGAPAHPASTEQILKLRGWPDLARDRGAGRHDGFRCLEPLPEGPPPGSVFAVVIGTFPPRRTSSFRARFLDGALVVVDQEDQRGREDHEEQS